MPGNPLPALQNTLLKHCPPPCCTSCPLLPVPLPNFLSESKAFCEERGCGVCPAQWPQFPLACFGGVAGCCVRHSGETWAVPPTPCCCPACPLGPGYLAFFPSSPPSYPLRFCLCSLEESAPLPSRDPFSALGETTQASCAPISGPCSLSSPSLPLRKVWREARGPHPQCRSPARVFLPLRGFMKFLLSNPRGGGKSS